MKTIRFIIGYLVGASIFAVGIPSGIIYISHKLDPLLNISLCDSFTARLILSLPLFLLGSFFGIWSNIALFEKGKGGPVDAFNVAISPRSESLVVTGPYRYTRNPMVFGAWCIYFSIALFINSFAGMLFCLVFSGLILLFLKSSEEKRLVRDFGKAYQDYKARVPMIIPLPKIKRAR